MKQLLEVLRKKSIFGEVSHVLLNILLALAVYGLVYIGGWAIYTAVFLVLLSKWRIFAVRPRYWWANILANIVDISVSLSMVVLLTIASESGVYSTALEYGVVASYIIWLVLIKPRSHKNWVLVQAVTTLFFGTWAIAEMSHMMPMWLVVAAMYVIGYGAARHVLTTFEESDMSLVSMVHGLITAEVAWLIYHWNIAYGLRDMGDFRVPQMAIIVVALSLAMYKMLLGFKTNDKKSDVLKSADILAPVVFACVVIVVLLVFFSSQGPGII